MGVLTDIAKKTKRLISRKSRSQDNNKLPKDLSGHVRKIYRTVRPFTMTSPERINALIESLEYLVENDIPGDIVECGVWRGGSMMAAALALKRMGATDRELLLYDTFDGMPQPGDEDVDLEGRKAFTLMGKEDRETSYVWAVAQLEEVQRNMTASDYPAEKISYIKGKVQETLPEQAPDRIALLRLDTDWYDSTKHELEHLYPRLVPGGVLIIDDYGHWQGARRAVDEYLEKLSEPLLLSRIDYTGRLAVKIR